MMSERRFLALIGSPRVPSTSETLAEYVADGLAKRGWETGIIRLFARDAGLQWLGGLALGAGGAINGQKLEKMGNSVAHVVRALDLTVEALDADQPIPDAVLQLIRRRFCSMWLYVLLANVGMLKGALDNHVLMKIHARPYA